MKTLKNILLSLAASLPVLVSCQQKASPSVPGSRLGFSLSFFRNAVSEVPSSENTIVSPYSAGVVLSMLEDGAAGQTKVEFDNALNGCIFDKEDLGSDDTVKVLASNSLWIDDDFSVRNSYLFKMDKDYDALVETLNFADPATIQAINNWCSEHTEGKITEIIDRLDPGMVMVLADALYFNAPWKDPFDPSVTHKDVFYGVTGQTKIDYMVKKAYYSYAEYQGCQLIRIPYESDRYSMYIMLPAKGMKTSDVLPYLSEDVVNTALSSMKPAQVRLSMPKFKQDFGMVLNSTLKKMGIVTAFTQAADFKGIAEMGPLVLDQVKQKCYIDVTEKGTEAAAVTVAQMKLTSARPQPFVNMTVDRPFLFFIADMEKSNVLFAGNIVNL